LHTVISRGQLVAAVGQTVCRLGQVVAAIGQAVSLTGQVVAAGGQVVACSGQLVTVCGHWVGDRYGQVVMMLAQTVGGPGQVVCTEVPEQEVKVAGITVGRRLRSTNTIRSSTEAPDGVPGIFTVTVYWPTV
jgi:hypothetical protein